MARSTTSEAVVLRSFRLGEADRILHVYTQDRGRVGAVAKGVRKTKSRFGARLEPFSHVELVLHQGRGELETVTGASLVHSHDRIRTDPYRLQAGMIGLEAMLRLFPEQEANDKAFTALTRFLDALDEVPARPGMRAALDPVVLSFQLKLLWVSGLHAAPRDVRRVRLGRSTRGLSRVRGRWRVQRLRSRRDPALSRGRARDARAPPLADRRRHHRRARRAGPA